MTTAKTIGKRMLDVACAALLVAVGAAFAEGPGDFVVPGSKAATEQSCVEDTEYMRRNHFELIRHQRDDTVYSGIRSTKHSLAGCVGCHAVHDGAGEPVPINQKKQFCASCHAYAAVMINCFDCHATVPEGEAWNHAIENHTTGHPAGHATLSTTPTPASAAGNPR